MNYTQADLERAIRMQHPDPSTHENLHCKKGDPCRWCVYFAQAFAAVRKEGYKQGREEKRKEVLEDIATTFHKREPHTNAWMEHYSVVCQCVSLQPPQAKEEVPEWFREWYREWGRFLTFATGTPDTCQRAYRAFLEKQK